jgi:peptide/nickel transport system permease protein
MSGKFRFNGALSLLIITILVVLAVFADQIGPTPNAQDLADRLAGPSAEHWLGTDHLGRDLFSRVVHGARMELMVAVPAVLLALLVGTLIGLLAGYAGKAVDWFLSTIIDVLQSFPSIILGLFILTLAGPSTSNILIVLAIAFAPSYARVVRALIRNLKEQPFVESERILGASHPRIVLRHLLPNLIGPCLVLVAMDIPSAIAVEAGLSFLGVGFQLPTPSWGTILSEGFNYLRKSPWPVLSGAVVLILATLSFTFFGESLRDRLDPRASRLLERQELA